MELSINHQLLAMRPIIPQATINDQTSANEIFQNQTLRPIIKLLNTTILSSIKNQLRQFNSQFGQLTREKKIDTLRTFIEKNQSIRHFLCGMVVGQMTTEELLTYLESTSGLNKRILQMIAQRAIDHLDFF
ncbi:MAG: glyoxalase [Putridiphycobacter sp.]|nr:glyoxalase [Putridiphycobacter sp.]